MTRALTNESTVDGSLDDDASEMELMDHQTSPDSAASDGEPALEAFLARFPSDTGEAVTSEDIAAVYDFPLDGFQREATTALLRGDSVVVSAPTGSGKTLVGETAIMTALARGQKAIYTTPLKALSNQKLREFQALFGVRRVGLKTGDVDINTADADVVVMTTEILRNMLYPRATESDGTNTHPSVSQSATVTGGWTTSGWWSWTRCTTSPTRTAARCGRRPSSTARPGCNCCVCPRRWETRMTWRDGSRKCTVSGDVRGQRCRTIVSDYRPVPLNWHFSMRPGRMWPGLGPLLNRNSTKLNYELFPFTKEGAREWEAANGGGPRGGPNQWGEYESENEADGEYEGGFFRKKSKNEFPKFDGGRKGGAGGGRGKSYKSGATRGGRGGRGGDARTGAAAGAAAGTARGADPSERRRRRLRIGRRGDGWSRTWRRPWGSSSPRPCYPRCGSYSAGKAATRLRSTSRTAAPSW
jgi:hypothetical protein